MGYHRAGFDVIGVDIEPQPNYPFQFVQANALDWLLGAVHGFEGITTPAAIHASPPCQAFTAYKRRRGHVAPRENLIPDVRHWLRRIGLPYVMENVQGAPLERVVQLCGSSFGLDVRRHRYFESNVPFVVPPCDHGRQSPRFAPATNRTNLRSTVEVGVWRIPLDVQQRAMGIDWMTRAELSQAIPPAYTEYLGKQLLAHINARKCA